MNKLEIQKRVLQNGEELDLDLFSWDEKTNTFSTKENNLVLDFSDISYCTFKTGSNCIFDTGFYCIFDTEENCVVVRRDIYEVIEIKDKIKLNGFKIKGFEIIKETDNEI